MPSAMLCYGDSLCASSHGIEEVIHYEEGHLLMLDLAESRFNRSAAWKSAATDIALQTILRNLGNASTTLPPHRSCRRESAPGQESDSGSWRPRMTAACM